MITSKSWHFDLMTIEHTFRLPRPSRSLALLLLALSTTILNACAQDRPADTISHLGLGFSRPIFEDSAHVLIDPNAMVVVNDSLLATTLANGSGIMVINARSGRIIRSIIPPTSLLDSAFVSNSLHRHSTFFKLERFSAMLQEHGSPDPSFASFYRPQYLRIALWGDSTEPTVLMASRVPARSIITNDLVWPSVVGVVSISLSEGTVTGYHAFNVQGHRFPQRIALLTDRTHNRWVTTYDFEQYKAKRFDSLPYLCRYDADGNQTKHCIMLPRRSAERKAYFSLHNDIIPLDHDVAATVDVVTGDVVIFDLGNDSAIEIPRDEWLKRTNIKADSLTSFLHPCRSGADEIEFVVTQSDSLRNVVSSILVRLRMTKDGTDVAGVSPMFKDTKIGPGYSSPIVKDGTTQWPIRRLIYRGVQWHFVDIESR